MSDNSDQIDFSAAPVKSEPAIDFSKAPVLQEPADAQFQADQAQRFASEADITSDARQQQTWGQLWDAYNEFERKNQDSLPENTLPEATIRAREPSDDQVARVVRATTDDEYLAAQYGITDQQYEDVKKIWQTSGDLQKNTEIMAMADVLSRRTGQYVSPVFAADNYDAIARQFGADPKMSAPQLLFGTLNFPSVALGQIADKIHPGAGLPVSLATGLVTGAGIASAIQEASALARYAPAITETGEALPSFAEIASKLPNVSIPAAGGLALFQAQGEVLNIMLTHAQDKPHIWGQTSGLPDLLPEDADERLKMLTEVLDVFGKGMVAGGAMTGTKALWKDLAYTNASTIVPSQKLYIPAEEIAKFYTGAEGTGRGSDYYDILQKLDLDNDTVRPAAKFGLDVEVPLSGVVKSMDRPWWGAVKGVLKMSPYLEETKVGEGAPTSRLHVSGELEAPAAQEAAAQAPGPEVPVKPVENINQNITKSPEVPAKPGTSAAQPQSLESALVHQESGGKDFNADGTPVTSVAGAKYAWQVMPSTAANPGFGITPAQSDTPEEYNRVGKELLVKLQEKYSDPMLAVAAYNAGTGTVDKLIAKYGDPRTGAISQDDFISHLPVSKTNDAQAYVKSILAKAGVAGALGTGLTREAFAEAINKNPSIPQEQKDAFLAVADAAARSWAADEEGRAPEDWYPTYFGGVRTGEAPEAALSQYGGERAAGWPEAEGKFSSLYDGMQRFEIDDSKAALTALVGEGTTGHRPLDSILEHDELYKQYPGIKDLRTRVTIDPKAMAVGNLNLMGIEVVAPNKAEAKNILIHEVQHWIQNHEGFARGGNFIVDQIKAKFPDEFKAELSAVKNNPLWQWKPEDTPPGALEKSAAFKVYERHAGEIEARDTADRTGLTAEQRAKTPPYSSENIPPDQAILLQTGEKQGLGTPEENIARGDEAMERVIREHRDVLDAMYRPDVGGISFYWGSPGKGAKFKGGQGVAKIISKHGENVARMMPEVLAKGELTEIQHVPSGDRALIRHAGHTAVLSLYKFGNRETWLLTGWEDVAPGASGKGSDLSGATHEGPIRTRSNVGAEAKLEEKIAPLGSDGKPLFSGITDTKKGAVQFLQDGKAILHLFETADFSTLVHELGHILRRQLSPADMAVVEKWLKVQGGEWKRSQEEKFARAFEAYIMEGVAPSSRLRSIFQKMKSWMLEIYKSIRNLKVRLNDDIRAVFDRMLSTEAERKANVLYQMGDEYDAAPEGSLEAQALERAGKTVDDRNATIRAEMEKNLRREADKMYDEIAPAHVAKELSIRGLNRESLKDWDKDTVTALGRRWPGLVKKNGLWGLDEAAANHGFESGDDLMEMLLNAPTRVQFVENHVRNGMRAYADEAQLSEIERLASLVDAEIQIIKESAPSLADYVTAVGAPGKNYSEASAARPPRQLDSDYENLKAGIRMAARSARSAYASGKKEEALKAKIREKELLANLKAKIADRQERGKLYAKINKIADTATFSAKIEEGGREKRVQSEIPIEYRKQIQGILKSFGWKGFDKVEIENPEPLFDFLTRKREEGEIFESDFGDLDEMRGKPLRDFSTDDLRLLHECLNEISHKAKTAGILQTTADRKAVLEAAAEMAHRIIEMHNPNLAHGSAEALAPHEMPKDLMEKIRGGLRGWNISNLEVETLCEWLDGFSKELGPNWTYIYKPANDAGVHFDMLEADLKTLDKILEPFKTKIKGLGPWSNAKYHFPELGGKVLTKLQMLSFAKHWFTGIEGNRNALKRSFKVEDAHGNPQDLTDDQVKAVIAKLTRAEIEAVVAAMRIKNTPARQEGFKKTYLDNTGNEIKMIQPEDVTLPWGEVVPGYHASLIDNRDASYEMEERVARNETKSLYSTNYRPDSPKRGMTVARKAGASHILDLNFLATTAQEIIDQNRYVSHTIPLRDIRKVVNSPAFRGAVETYLGKEYHRMLMPWLQDQARPQSEMLLAPLKLLQRVRRNAVMVHIGIKLWTVVKHVPQLLMIAEAGSGPATLNAIFHPEMGTLTHPFRVSEFIRSKDPWMKNFMDHWDRDLSQFYKNFDPTRWALRDTIQKASIMPIDIMIGFLARTGWMSEYNRIMEGGGGEEKAVEYARKMVRDTVGSYDPKDLSAMRRGSEIYKLLTMFMTVPAALYQRFFRMGAQLAGPNQGDFAERSTRFFRSFCYIVLALGVADAVLSKRRTISGREAAEGVGFGLSNVLPIVRDVVPPIAEGFTEGRSRPYQMSPAEEALETPAKIARDVHGGKWDKHFFEDSLSALGYFTGLPTDQIATTAEGLYNFNEPGYHPWNVLVKPPANQHSAQKRGW